MARTDPKLNPNVSTYCSGGSTSLSPIYIILGEEIQGLIQENPGSCGTCEEKDSSGILGLPKINPCVRYAFSPYPQCMCKPANTRSGEKLTEVEMIQKGSCRTQYSLLKNKIPSFNTITGN